MEELLEDWEGARQSLEERLGARPGVSARVLEEEIGNIGQHLEALEQGELLEELEDPGERRERMTLEALRISERLRWLRRLLGLHFEASPPFHPASLLRAEIQWIRQQACDLKESGAQDSRLEELLEESARVRDELQHVALEGFILRCRESLEERDATREENPDAGSSGAASETAAGLEDFLEHWRPLEDHHEVLSGIDETDPRFQDLADSLRELHGEVLARIRKDLESAPDRVRGQFLGVAIQRMEDLVSGFISEGDLLEIPERIVKLRQVVQAIEEFQGIVRSCPGKKRRWLPALGDRLQFDKAWRRLRWLRYYAIKTLRSLQVEARLEARFGRAHMRNVETLVFFLIFALLALVGLEWYLDVTVWQTSLYNAEGVYAPAWGELFLRRDPPWAIYFQYADLLICLGLLGDFFLRWAHAHWRPWFFGQHFFFDFLPALPYGFIAGQMAIFHSTEYVHLALVIRLVGYQLRSAGPFLRLFRLLIFVVRGLDRIVSRFRGFLDRHILIFEAEDEGGDPPDPLVARTEKESMRGIALVRELLGDMPLGRRLEMLRRVLGSLRLEVDRLEPPDFALADPRTHAQDVELEEIIDRMVECDVLLVEKVIGVEGARQVARFLRWLDLPLLRRLPIIRQVARATRDAQPVESVAAASREIGQLLERVLAIFKVWGDLSGITTGPQILDRISTAMIRATQRPAVRLLLFGGLFLCVTLVFEFFIAQTVPPSYELDATGTAGEFAEKAHWFEAYVITPVQRILGWPLLVLGSCCLIVNFLGRWFKRIAGEALDVYLRTAEAHFFPLSKEVKVRRLEEDLVKIHDRVLRPECRLLGLGEESTSCALASIREKLELPVGSRASSRLADPALEDLELELSQISLLYRDFLDSSLFDRNDDQSSIQILGNMSIRDIRQDLLGQGKRDLRRLEHLALRKERLLGTGPYLWFRFISESMAIETAKLVLEYNSSCIPRSRVSTSSKSARARFEAFLELKRAELDPAARRVLRSGASLAEQGMLTTEFNALHFLVPDEERDRRIEERFGEEVARAMVRDRSAMVRDIFGTWPYHLLPRSVRRINLYRLYFKYLRGARIFLLPLVVGLRVVGLAFRALGRLRRVVEEVLGRAREPGARLTRVAGFDVARRKINRMRKSYFMEAMRLRAAVDVEYLGLRIPGVEPDPAGTTYLDDLRFIGALERERRPFERHRRRFLRDLRMLRQFLFEKGWMGSRFPELLERLAREEPSLAPGLEGAHHGPILRAIVTAFITDRFEFRSHVIGPRETQRFFDEVLAEPAPGFLAATALRIVASLRCALQPGCRRRRALFRSYESAPREGAPLTGARRVQALWAFLSATAEQERHARLAVESDPVAREQVLLKIIGAVVNEHSLWSRKLLTLRMIQTVTILDIAVYRDLVHELGEFTGPREVS